MDLERSTISKSESGQMSNSIGWFHERYPGCSATYVFAHPATELAPDAFLSGQAFSLTPDGVQRLKTSVSSGFASLQAREFESLSEAEIIQMLAAHELDEANLQPKFLRVVERSASQRS